MIGCGGAGLKTVRLVREGVQRRLDRAGWDGPFPDAWQFIGIDSSNYQEDPSIPTLPANDHISLVNHTNYTNIASAVDARFPQGSAGFNEMMGWRPHLPVNWLPMEIAAGQFRSAGRMVFIASQDIVRQRVSKAFAECAVGGPMLSKVSQRLGVTVPLGTPVPQPLTIVVGSMAGGTGAGIMLDVVDMLRRTDLNGAFPVMVAFTPDVFGGATSDQMTANSAAFVSEFLSAYWDDEATDSALIPSVIRTDTRGPHSTFMISRKNMDGLDLGNSKNVYRSVGEMLASVMTSARIQDQFTHHVWNRPFAGANNGGGYGWHENLTKGAVSSFGCATLSIGRDRFHDYFLRLLQRSIVEHLSEGFNQAAFSLLGAEAVKELSQQSKISELARIHHDEFMFACQLLENSNHRQISDSFVSDLHLHDEFQTVVDSMASSSATVQQLAVELWTVQMESQAHTARDASRIRAEELISLSLTQWGSDLLQRVLKTCTEFSARLSLPVVMNLVELARDDLLVSAALLKESAIIDRKNAEQMLVLAQSHLLTGLKEQIDPTGVPVQNAIQDYAKAISLEWLATVRDQLAATVESVSSGVLKAIQSELQRSINRMISLTTPQDGNPAVVSLWPRNDGVIPSSFAPSPVEFYLEDHTEWPQMARAILDASLGEDRHLLPVDPIEATRTRLIQGGFVGNHGDMVSPLISAETREDGILDWSLDQPVEVSIFDGLVDLEERIDSWLMRSSTATEECLSEGLSSYLSGVNPRTGVPVPNHTSRLATYQQKLEEALNQSRPLIEIDRKMYPTVHSQDIETSLNVEGFPFGEGHPARSITQEVVRGFLRTPGDVEWIFSGGEAESVWISSFLVNPVSPSVVSSFTEPFAQSMSNIVNESLLRSSFWLWRRARILENFIPLPDQLRLSAIRGFAITRALGYCTASIDEVNRVVDHKGVHEFPKYLLTATNRNNVLPALLESMVLTFADVPTKGKDAFNAYEALIDYGIGGGHADEFQLSKVMIDFLDYGVGPEAKYVYTPVDAGRAEKVAGHDFDSRKRKVLEYLDLYLSNLQRLDAQPRLKAYWRDSNGAVDPVDTLTLELMGDLTRGYTDVRTAVHNHYQEDVESVS
jgi:hypothetical protein